MSSSMACNNVAFDGSSLDSCRPLLASRSWSSVANHASSRLADPLAAECRRHSRTAASSVAFAARPSARDSIACRPARSFVTDVCCCDEEDCCCCCCPDDDGTAPEEDMALLWRRSRRGVLRASSPRAREAASSSLSRAAKSDEALDSFGLFVAEATALRGVSVCCWSPPRRPKRSRPSPPFVREKRPSRFAARRASRRSSNFSRKVPSISRSAPTESPVCSRR
mmetsp:Transcript_27811/g.85311  ORF Transcript_27811/g.85311 Transcript_27811/m.85311 type:complete len:224 (+) Transcript_27811:1963-2634(+)